MFDTFVLAKGLLSPALQHSLRMGVIICAPMPQTYNKTKPALPAVSMQSAA